jgi:uncharacterized membrane protein YkgB
MIANENVYALSKASLKETENNLAASKIIWFNRIALAVCFIWFGFLKIVHVSPAEGLVTSLYEVTIVKFVPLQVFLVLLGYVECLIGLLWLIPAVTQWAFALFALQMITTFLPLFFLPEIVWQKMLVPTLTGQYIIKNMVFLASAATVLTFFKKSKLGD